MEGHEYLLEILVRERLDDARALTARHALVARSRPPRVPFRVRIGRALVALGERLAGARPGLIDGGCVSHPPT